MPVEVRCACGAKLRVPSTLIGKAAPCARCKGMLRFIAPGGGPNLQEFDARLIVRAGPCRIGEQFLLGGAGVVQIGKLPDRHLMLDGERVSRSHAKLERSPRGWRIVDLNSSNGVFVNSLRETDQDLDTGDVITIGEYQLEYEFIGQVVEPVELTEIDEASEEIGVAPPPLPRAHSAPIQRQFEIPAAAPTFQATPVRVPIAVEPIPSGPVPVCPSCDKDLPHGATICVACGIHIRSGRPLLTAQGLDEDELHDRAAATIRWISWLIPFNIFPIASEAYGTRRPIATWIITGVTVLFSMILIVSGWASSDEELPPGESLALWAGDPNQTNPAIRELRDFVAYAREEQAQNAAQGRPGQAIDVDGERITRADVDEIEAILNSYERTARFHWYQFVTHALLHGGIFHLAGNMLFLLVFGTRVNALIGNAKTAVLYPILAVAAGMAHYLAVRNGPLGPMVGASGAIMGLAGMYFVLFPAHRVFTSIWLRLGPLLLLKTWALRGFWVVLFYIAFDVFATLHDSKDQTAHWAHLGGFLAGMFISMALLLMRVLNARGGDILSVVLGKHAWPLLGKPSRWRDDVPTSILAQRTVSLNYR